MAVKKKKNESKVGFDIRRFKEGSLRSGSKKGPVVKNKKQALAIGLSEARKAGEKVSPKKKAKKKK